mgnify:CR=1 FL=1
MDNLSKLEAFPQSVKAPASHYIQKPTHIGTTVWVDTATAGTLALICRERHKFLAITGLLVDQTVIAFILPEPLHELLLCPDQMMITRWVIVI